MPKYEFQINLGYCKGTVSGCGKTPDGFKTFTAPSLRMLLRKICKKTSIKIDQIILTFQPDPLP